MKNSIVAVIMTFILGATGAAQVNKVGNPNFDNVEKKIKGPGQLTLALEWYSPEGTPEADLYEVGSKKEEVSIPLNVRGRCETKEGEHYAGFLAYSEREASPRTYLQTKLPKKLVEGKRYCLKMNVQLSDISKYAVDNIGMYVSSKGIRAKDIEAYDIAPQLTHSGNLIVEDMFDWVEVCQPFTADGTERYVTIGNFAPQTAVKTKKMRRPREFKIPQTRDGYYFVDAVSVIALGHLEVPCDCQVIPETGPELDVVYTKNVSTDIEGTPEERLAHMVIHFKKNLAILGDQDRSSADKVADILTENPNMNIELVGHAAQTELEEVGAERAKAVYTYLVTEKGIDANRINHKGDAYNNPKVDGMDAQANAENRRVEFIVR